MKSILETPSSEVVPFVFAGTGKTQTAFALKSALREYEESIKYIYLTCNPVGIFSREYYKLNFNNASDFFIRCAELDLRALEHGPKKLLPYSVSELDLSCNVLYKSQLYLYGFFAQMLSNTAANDLKLMQKAAQDVCVENGVVIVLDDFPVMRDESSQITQLLRNSIRSLRSGLVIMARSTSCNMGEPSTEPNQPFCYLFPRLPPLAIENFFCL